DRVSKRFGNQQSAAVHDLNLEIHDKELLTLVGPSGCGKSTTLNMLAGLEDPSEGLISIDDRVVNDVPPGARDIAMVFQSYALYPHMTVRQNIGFGLEVRGVKKDEIARRVNEAAQLLDIGPLLDRRPKELSGGQRQRVALGRAITRDPKVFLLDEPLSNLDAQLRAQMRAELRLLFRRIEGTVVYVTHDQAEAMTLSDRLVVMRHGIVQQVGTPLEVYNNPVNLFVGKFLGSPSMSVISGTAGVRNGDAVIETVGGALAITRDMVSTSALTADRSLTIGIRPEDILIAPGHGDGLHATVEVIESMGSVNVVYARLGAERVAVTTPPTFTATFDDPVTLTFDPGKTLLFDPQTENRVA
ncbi:MAG: sn-glycerol-3-phosphate ABC transporter ATP-binding protein UgpC, partial [Thermomicrobiales bacterium]|nr:sn-glycerol-3-phosphate ABC transporter ATP-binding protein UgpC [Thermomicrobiales bacterium]